ncbi:MAG TPA: amino acid permease, partial [Propionibacteriaceae bacterium]|nr:amino acid permease [Propionibacteriaceae bacterium]
MIGAGVFAVWAPAAAAAGSWLLVSVGLAALVAFCNAWSSARLAARYPSSGGTYLYGREVLGEWWGFLAGWGFVIGKTASCAAMALTFASYVLPGSAWARPLAALVVLALALLNTRGVTKTAALARALVIPVLVILIGAIGLMGLAAPLASPALVAADAYGVLQAAGLLFFAFAGYARIATMGEEVRDPSRTIPRAIIGALTLTVALYAGLGWVLLARLGPDGLATSPDPV